MKIARITTLALAGALALAAAPAIALPPMIPDNPGAGYIPPEASDQGAGYIPPEAGSHGSEGASNAPSDPSSQGAAYRPETPGPKAGMPAKAKAYGQYCDTQSRKRVEGQRGTPFSLCVTAMAKVANGKANPRTACKAESKKHVDGEKGTPFSRCVSGAAKLRKDQEEQESIEETTAGTDTPAPSADGTATDPAASDTASPTV